MGRELYAEISGFSGFPRFSTPPSSSTDLKQRGRNGNLGKAL
jgi:hypothetical protein